MLPKHRATIPQPVHRSSPTARRRALRRAAWSIASPGRRSRPSVLGYERGWPSFSRRRPALPPKLRSPYRTWSRPSR